MNGPMQQYQQRRIAHWNRVVSKKEKTDRWSSCYHGLLHHYYRLMVPRGLKILEIGCGMGDLLSALEPSHGVGIDFAEEMLVRARQRHPRLTFIHADAHDLPLRELFDVIILSDLVNDLWDVQTVLEKVRNLCHPGTRVITNFFNNIWRIPLGVVKRLGLGADVLEQNWFSPHDVSNLLELAGFEVIDVSPRVLLPLRIRFLETLANRYLVNLIPFNWFGLTNIMIARPISAREEILACRGKTVSVIVAARNEAGNIENILKRVPELGDKTEIVFVEGHSSDQTYETIEDAIKRHPEKHACLFRQTGKGKGDAVRLGFEKASGDILMILDADLTVPPEDLPRFVQAMTSGKGDFINGVRLVYPMEDKAMRFLNIIGNKFFSLAFTWLLGQPIKDTLCGTKVLWKKDYDLIVSNRSYFGEFDPFGDFDLLFGAAKLNLKIAEVPIRYRERVYGTTNISRFSHGWLLLKMVLFAAKRIKFI
ncbi:MAG: glycosyltransferase [Thermodesulfobacteriota bacterium]